jgi:hypothetical protein
MIYNFVGLIKSFQDFLLNAMKCHEQIISQQGVVTIQLCHLPLKHNISTICNEQAQN